MMKSIYKIASRDKPEVEGNLKLLAATKMKSVEVLFSPSLGGFLRWQPETIWHLDAVKPWQS